MPGPYPLPTLAAAIGPTGIHAPPFQDVYASLIATYQGIYGSDAYLDPDSQDGQLLASFAAIISDCNNACIAVYNSFSPSTAVGAGLSSNVKLNGLQRRAATSSTVDIDLIGSAGTLVTNGVVADPVGNNWRLPHLVTIPPTGSIIATATAVTAGVLLLSSGTAMRIVNPQRGWQKAIAASDASPGMPVETDAQLRVRQSQSTSLPAQTPLESIVAGIQALPTVTEIKAYENDTGEDWVGDPTQGIPPLPGHSIAIVVAGGDSMDIATIIATGKLGCGTFGTESEVVIDRNGVADVIFFSRPDYVAIRVQLLVTALNGYSAAYGNAMAVAMAAWVNVKVPIGGSVNVFDMINACWLGPPAQGTYKLEPDSLSQCIIGDPGGLQVADIQMDWNQEPTLAVGSVTVEVPSGP